MEYGIRADLRAALVPTIADMIEAGIVSFDEVAELCTAMTVQLAAVADDDDDTDDGDGADETEGEDDEDEEEDDDTY